MFPAVGSRIVLRRFRNPYSGYIGDEVIMAKVENIITVTIDIKFHISLWEAIKIRIAGDNIKPIVRIITTQMEGQYNYLNNRNIPHA
jgi:hypothetical protein